MNSLSEISARTGILILLIYASLPSLAQTPSASDLFQKMKEKIATIKTISYQLQSRNMDGGQADSVFMASSVTWVQRIPSDTIFGSYFHIKQTNKNGKADYFYDGTNAIDIYHTHKAPDFQKTVTVIEPFRLSNDMNVIEARTTSRGYSKELLQPESNARWMKYLDSMKVLDKGRYWIIEWKENVPDDDFYALQQVYVEKASGLIHEIHRHSTWRSVPNKYDVVISNIQVNRTQDLDSVKFKDIYTDYKIKYVNRKNYGGTPLPSLKGKKAEDFTYTSFWGDAITLKAKKGKLLLLDFWETWCGYCFIAMPKIKNAYQQYHEKGLEVVAVVTENKEQVRKIINAQKFPYPTVFGDEKIKQSFKVEGRPRYILIDDNGMIVEDSEGDLEKVLDTIKNLLK